jgi:ubiquinone/menaquinone biosynthesis C-methylase UbiE
MSRFPVFEFNSSDPRFVLVNDELPLWSAPFGFKLLDIICLRPHLNVLDIGPGTGFPLLEIAQMLGDSGRVYGLDPWAAALDRIRQKIEILGLSNVSLHEGRAENQPFRDGFFDLIVSNNGISNVGDMRKTFEECFRVAKPGAQFVFTMNTEETMIEFYGVFQKILKEKGLTDAVQRMKEHIHEKRKPLFEVQRLVLDAGFEVSRVLTDSFRFRYLNGTAMFGHFMIRSSFLGPWKSVVPPDRVEEVFTTLENCLNELARARGEIALTIPFIAMDCRRN